MIYGTRKSFCLVFCSLVLTSSGRGAPASDIPKDEEMADLIGDDEDSPTSPLSHLLTSPNRINNKISQSNIVTRQENLSQLLA